MGSFRTRSELADFPDAVEVAACLEEGAVGEELAGGAPGVGEDHEGSDGVGGEVEEDGVSVTVFFQNGVVWVVAAAVGREELARWANVGSVQEDYSVEVGHSSVH